MPTQNIDLLKEINSISKIHTLKRDDIDTMMVEFASRITYTLHIEKLSVWLLSSSDDNIVSMGEYDRITKEFKKGSILNKSKCPNYFNSISDNEILIVPNVYESEATKELSDSYFSPDNIISLMGIPLRIEGKLVGIMCFEKIGDEPRIFSEKDKLFALSVSLVFASNLEARQRRAVQHLLDDELKEKDVLIKEINHRVKNNLSVVVSLLNMQLSKAKDTFHKKLFEECQSKVEAIASIHRITQNAENFGLVNIQDFVERLTQDLLEFHASEEREILISQEIDSISITIDQAVPLALIINEVITNAYKHAFPENRDGLVTVKIKSIDGKVNTVISDNGIGFNFENIQSGSIGIDIIDGLCEQLDGEMKYDNSNGTTFTMSFPELESSQ